MRRLDERPLPEREYVRRGQRRLLADAEHFQAMALDPDVDPFWRGLADRLCSSLMRTWAASSIAGLPESDKPHRT